MLSEYKVKSILNVNFLIPIKLVSNALSTWSNSPQLKKIIYISSIAAIRPINHYIYSSGKIAFEYILRGIVNKKEFKHISTYIFRAGNITTNSLLTTSSDNLAKYILNNINGKSGLFYFPFIWNYLSFIISIIPNFIFIKILPFLIEV
jgi:short-subunit dehydrogenase